MPLMTEWISNRVKFNVLPGDIEQCLFSYFAHASLEK